MRQAMQLLLVLVCVGLAVASTTIEVVTECPHHPGQCFDSHNNEFYVRGSTWSRAGECAQYTCNFPQISGNGCGTVGVEPPCVLLPGNLSLAYPECCPSGFCPKIADRNYN